jgi:hypothetical protein
MLSVVMLSVVMLSVVMLSVIMMSVVGPFCSSTNLTKVCFVLLRGPLGNLFNSMKNEI